MWCYILIKEERGWKQISKVVDSEKKVQARVRKEHSVVKEGAKDSQNV